FHLRGKATRRRGRAATATRCRCRRSPACGGSGVATRRGGALTTRGRGTAAGTCRRGTGGRWSPAGSRRLATGQYALQTLFRTGRRVRNVLRKVLRQWLCPAFGGLADAATQCPEGLDKVVHTGGDLCSVLRCRVVDRLGKLRQLCVQTLTQ